LVEVRRLGGGLHYLSTVYLLQTYPVKCHVRGAAGRLFHVADRIVRSGARNTPQIGGMADRTCDVGYVARYNTLSTSNSCVVMLGQAQIQQEDRGTSPRPARCITTSRPVASLLKTMSRFPQILNLFGI